MNEEMRNEVMSMINEALAGSRDISERERSLEEREMRAFAREYLAEKDMPASIADALPVMDKDACAGVIDALEQAFREAVKAAVAERLAGEPPANGDTVPDTDSMSDAEYYASLGA